MYSNQGLVDLMRDNRTEAKFRSDYQLNHQREDQVMQAMCAEYRARGVIDVSYADINPDERNGISFTGGVRMKPDRYLYVNGKTFTYEIKFNNAERFHDFDGVESVFIKCGAIITMVKDTRTYPNGFALIATSRKFAILPASAVGKYPIEPIDYYGGKKCFVIPVDHLDWKPWMTPIAEIVRPRQQW